MAHNFYIIQDLSGSMAEEGKKAAALYASKAIIGFIATYHSDVTYFLKSWSESIKDFSSKDQPQSRASVFELVDFCNTNLDASIVILTDGALERSEARTLKRLSSHPSLHVVLIGVDAIDNVWVKALGKERLYACVDALECARNLLMKIADSKAS